MHILKKNADELSKYYSEEYMNDKRKENYSKWLNSMESITMKPYKIIPLQNGGNFRQVIAWSKEERVHKNGSYEKLDLMESFVLDNDGKVKSFKQWKAIDSVNFGMPYGGKFFGNKEGEYAGRPLVFSNRNETKMIESMVESYNKMDVEGMKNVFADEFILNDYKGEKATYKKSDLENFFSPFKSVDWKINAIIPIKIANTDAASGVRNILKMCANGIEVGPILMGMGNKAHIVTPSITARGLLNIATLAGTPVKLYG